MKKIESRKIAPGIRDPMPSAPPTHREDSVKKAEARPENLEPGKSYPVQAVCKDDRGNLLAFDLEKGFSPYIPGSGDQRLFLNRNNTLIAKEKDNCYISICFEKDEKKGKYCLYLDGFGQTVYFSVNAEDGTTEDKRRASHFDFYDFRNGSKLEEIPSDSFFPAVIALRVKSGGELTDRAVEFGYHYPRLSRYDPANPYQKFAVCRYEDQLVVFSDSMGLKGEILLTPQENGSDDYLFCMAHSDAAGNEVQGYLALGENGKLDVVTENQEEALHFALADSPLPVPGISLS